MEAYAGSIAKVKHTIYFDGIAVEADLDVTLTIYNHDDLIIGTYPGVAVVEIGEDPYYYVTIGQDITNDYEVKTMEWEYTVDGNPVTTPREFLVIVNPYVTYSQFKLMYPSTNIENWEFSLVEPVVRKVIETYANQTFTREDGVSYVITGQNSDSLPLPKQLISLDAIEVMDSHLKRVRNIDIIAGDRVVRADGPDHSLIEQPYAITEYITFDPNNRWSLRRRTNSYVNRAMSATTQRSMFKYPMRYRVTGSFGWDMVPEDVVRAAAILVNDYACSDAKYREKYIANIRAGDWRMEFIATGDETTGNANADMILSRFRNVGLAVI